MAIWFNTETKNFKVKNKRKLKSWIKFIISSFEYETGNLNYIFVDRETILNINKRFLNHSYYTDIITFDNREIKSVVEADIYLCPDVIKENSEYYKTDFNEELKRVIIHGILHLVGFTDKSPDEISIMRQQENAAIKHVKDLLIV